MLVRDTETGQEWKKSMQGEPGDDAAAGIEGKQGVVMYVANLIVLKICAAMEGS